MGQMTEHEPEVQTDPVTKVARDLTAITELVTSLESQAIARSNDHLMPGGLAMVSLAHDASLAEWAEQAAALELYHLAVCPDGRWECVVTEYDEDKKPIDGYLAFGHHHCTYAEHVADEDDQDSEDPLLTLLFWSEAWRDEHGFPLEGRTATIETEAGVIRHLLNWAWDNEPHFEDMARDVNHARQRLESMLLAGKRAARTRVPCSNPACERKPLLIKVYGDKAVYDHWKCTCCKHRYSEDEFKRALAAHLRSEGADKYVPQADAVSMLRAQGAAKRTIYRWLGPAIEHVEDRCKECKRRWPPQEHPVCPGKVKLADGSTVPCGGELKAKKRGNGEQVILGYCDIKTHRTWLWWPDLWGKHRERENAKQAEKARARLSA